MEPRGKTIVVAAPSGAGKTSIVRGLLAQHSFLAFSISATTRKKRPHEVDGKDYHFFTNEQFHAKVENGDFLEYEEVYKNTFYGTLYAEVNKIWAENKHIIFDVDVEGALNIKETFGDNCLNLFIKPPSLYTLYERLKNRNTETEESLQKRITKAEKELKYQTKFDQIVINDKLDVAINDASKIVCEFLKIPS